MTGSHSVLSSSSIFVKVGIASVQGWSPWTCICPWRSWIVAWLVLTMKAHMGNNNCVFSDINPSCWLLITSVFPKARVGVGHGCRGVLLDSSVFPMLVSSVSSSFSNVDVTPIVSSRSAITPFSKDGGAPGVAFVPGATDLSSRLLADRFREARVLSAGHFSRGRILCLVMTRISTVFQSLHGYHIWTRMVTC
jgi:hypothetical protein